MHMHGVSSSAMQMLLIRLCQCQINKIGRVDTWIVIHNAIYKLYRDHRSRGEVGSNILKNAIFS